MAILASASFLGGCIDKTEYVEVDYEAMFHDQESLPSKDVKARATIDHLEHSEWTTVIMSCSKNGCIPIYVHHERDDWKICDTEGNDCRKWSSSDWNHPKVEGQGFVYGHIKWKDCKFLWWNTCDNPGYRTKVTDVAAT